MPRNRGLCNSSVTLGFPEEDHIILDCDLSSDHNCQHEVVLIQDRKVITVFWQEQ